MENATILNRPRGLKGFFARREATVAVIVVLLAIIVGATTRGIFFTPQNLQATFISLAGYGIMAVAMTFVLVTGGIDLSVGSTYGLAAMTVAALTKYYSFNIWVAVILGLMIALGMGALNGFFVSKVKLAPMIATIGTMSVGRGLCYVISNGSNLTPNNTSGAFRFIGSGIIGFIPMYFIIFIIIAVIAEILLKRSVPVRRIFYTGSNETAAKLSGIKTANVKFTTYLYGGLLCGIAGILYISRFNTAAASAGRGAEMKIIAACVIGGASLTGGEGTVLGAVLGTFLMSFLDNAQVLWKVSVYYQDLISGLILLAAVSIDAITHMRKK
jgi:ribose transport system permease protein